jgi:DNA-binding LacI/PurR family transcriptional regulator
MTTTRDIAERLDLSVSTVGRALADDHRISAETKFRVNQVAEELGYVVNRAARMMRGARSTVVGLVVPDVRNSFYSTVAHALTETMSSRDHQVMLCETGDDRQSELRQVRDLTSAQVAGVVIVPTPKPHPDVVRMLRAIPHVQLLRKVPSLGPHWFGIDDRHVIQTAAEHLLELGHRRIGYIGGTTDIPTAAARLSGFNDAVAAAGLPNEAGVAVLRPPSSAEQGASAFIELLDSADPPTGIVTGSVQITRGVLDAAQQRGVDVPRDLSVVGFGDEPGFSWWGPGLTTISLPMHDLATACGVWLLHRLSALSSKDPATKDAPYSSVSAGTLIERGSTAAPRIRRRSHV